MLSIVLFLLFISSVEGCSLVKADVKTALLGEGFHRTLRTNVKLSSVKRLLECRVSYFFEIPRGAFVDSDALNLSLLDHCHLCTPFDVEAVEHDPRLEEKKPLIFQSKEVLRNVFLFEDQLEFPLHLRYKRASNDESGMSFPTVIPPPQIFLRCEQNETLMAEGSCKKNVQRLACGCTARPRCDFFRLDFEKPPSLRAAVPIGRLWEAKAVTCTTLLVVLFALLYAMRDAEAWAYVFGRHKEAKTE